MPDAPSDWGYSVNTARLLNGGGTIECRVQTAIKGDKRISVLLSRLLRTMAEAEIHVEQMTDAEIEFEHAMTERMENTVRFERKP